MRTKNFIVLNLVQGFKITLYALSFWIWTFKKSCSFWKVIQHLFWPISQLSSRIVGKLGLQWGPCIFCNCRKVSGFTPPFFLRCFLSAGSVPPATAVLPPCLACASLYAVPHVAPALGHRLSPSPLVSFAGATRSCGSAVPYQPLFAAACRAVPLPPHPST
jgi:hypothetical protein